MILLKTNFGDIKVELNHEKAPKTAANFEQYVKDGFYDGVIFHRVIDGFMAQTGDPTGTGTGGSKYNDLPAEFNDTNFGRGAVGMARASSPDSANSQFFICFNDCAFLNGQYTVFAQVTEGMEFVDAIQKGEPPANPDKIVSMKVQADATADAAPATTE